MQMIIMNLENYVMTINNIIKNINRFKSSDTLALSVIIDHLYKIRVTKKDNVDVVNNTLIITDNLNHIYWINIEHINAIIFNMNEN